jgi:hypothetical protein
MSAAGKVVTAERPNWKREGRKKFQKGAISSVFTDDRQQLLTNRASGKIFTTNPDGHRPAVTRTVVARRTSRPQEQGAKGCALP